ncbi:DUF1549 domain-containing protein [Phragmitibacter flavus]|uniref:DUF1549 domain-containing protein n=1 Tax=Phragmitibacter flavus TaxID=2576071 RepID=A0A5R8KFX1_9BACT|nr:PSD1 and planctomycete cytochrome C domain-containing protein [Phragmitibacter flavus]TLD71190.1 DUF1549 domain-containing protein [Phragmitibacter flavus]
MKKTLTLLLLLSASFNASAASDVTAEADAQREAMLFFENDIRPILANRCYSCHGEDKQKAGLRVDDINHLLAGGDTGAALTKGDPDKSLFIEAVRYQNADFQMPPKEKLPDNEIALLEKWVAMGAPWPQTAEQAKAGARDEFGFTAEDRSLWSLQPLAKPTPPANVGQNWAKNSIDSFIAAKHAETKLTPAPTATPRELIRRAYYDLTGLPPTTEQVAAFEKDPSDVAYAKLIDTLLATPQYGERWAQHWLDLVRFAESDGYNADAYRPAAWPYRDWVINAFNNDMPYDQFVRYQLAGDEINPEDPNVLVATSYLRNGIYEWNQRDVRGQHQLIVEDMTDTTGELFLGLSMGCARCHNHKFDPILQKDYYRLQAFFTPVLWRTDLKLATPEEKAAHAKQTAEWEAATVQTRAQMQAMVGKYLESKKKSAFERFRDDIEVMMHKDPNDREPLEHQLASLAYRQVQYEEERFTPLTSLKKDEDKKAYQALEAELKKFDHLKPKPLLDAFVATDAKATFPPTILKTRAGETDIAPGFLTILEPGDINPAPIGNSTGRRTALANWMTRPDNQLTTRTIVNRIWAYHFGRGISSVTSDLGNMGEKPTHPELLDWLAQEFVSNGWSFKKLHRTIMLSATYRQTALRTADAHINTTDPGNTLLWRFHPRRLDAEQARDSMLTASGEIDVTLGGEVKDAAKTTRRAIYVTKKRNNQDEFLRNLDAPAGFLSAPERQTTTTPTQALFMLNGDWVLTRARELATRSKTIDEAWQNALGRSPTAKEAELAHQFLRNRAGEDAYQLDQSTAKDTDEALFKDGTPHERILVKDAKKEGDDFTIEALVTLDSIDVNASVRTIVSRWNLGKDNLESFGWSLGVTGIKSRYKPNNLIVQLVGEDENTNIGYEVVPSDLHLKLNTPYYLAVTVSCAAKTVTFRVTDLSQPNQKPTSVVIPHDIRRGISKGASSLVIGGLNQRTPTHHWDGRIDALRLSLGAQDEDRFHPKANLWKNALVNWNATKPLAPGSEWSGFDGKSDSNNPLQNAMTDLCHVLLNSNEFLYLH